MMSNGKSRIMKKLMQRIYAGGFAVLLGFMPLIASTSLGAEEWEPKKTHALIVGVLEWKNGFSPFPKRDRKDKELRDLLIKRGTPAENVTMLLDQEATLSKIRKAITQTLSKTSKDSTLIIYYDGHGWAAGDDFCFSTYDVGSNRKDNVWSINELAATVAKEFKGRRAFFWADCCFSGGMKVIVEKLADSKIACFSLTSAATENSSTRNWTFTQSLLDGLSGAPLIDTNGDGRITLGELRTEVRDAMNHMEGQKHGFKTNGLDDTFVLAKASGRLTEVPKAKYHVGSYVRAKGKYGRVVGVKGDKADKYSVQFYNYTDKIVKQYAEKDLVASTRPTTAVNEGIPSASTKTHSVWQGTYDQVGWKVYPMILFIHSHTGDAFEGMTWYPTLSNGVVTISGEIKPDGVVTFTEDEVIYRGEGGVASGCIYTGSLEGNTLKGFSTLKGREAGHFVLKLAD